MAEPTKEEAHATIQPYNGLYSDIETRTSPEKPLLLAHYTTVKAVEQILKNEEMWFANPLYINDSTECVLASFSAVRFGTRSAEGYTTSLLPLLNVLEG
jgi:hypothetical protein